MFTWSNWDSMQHFEQRTHFFQIIYLQMMYLWLVNQSHKGAELLQKSKILQQFSKPLHYQLCPAIALPHIMCQSYYQLSQSICFKRKKPTEVHQITSNTQPAFLIPCGNNQWTVLDQLTPSKDDVRDLCLVLVTDVGVLGNEGTLERWVL
jgi:hypothetical protein